MCVTTRTLPALLLLLVACALVRAEPAAPVDVFPGTAPLISEDDLTSELVAGVDRFLLREIEQSVGAQRLILASRHELCGGVCRVDRAQSTATRP